MCNIERELDILPFQKCPDIRGNSINFDTGRRFRIGVELGYLSFAETSGVESRTLTIAGESSNTDQIRTTGPKGVKWMIFFFIS